MKLNAIRDNIDSTEITIDCDDVLKAEPFREYYRGRYTNGHRVNEDALCRRFRHPDDDYDDGYIVSSEFNTYYF